MKILVTGGAGFIGSHVTDKLLVGNNKVVVIDDFNDYYDPQIKRQNLNQAKDHPNFELIDGDIRDQALISSIFTKNKFDSVIHLAARAGVRPSLSNPKLYWDVNVMGTLNILEAMKDTGVKNLVFAGSSSVYGNRGDGPFNETDNTDQPISPYGASKKAGEVLIATYAHLYGIRTTVLRFFTAYGPRNRPDMAMSLLAKASNTGTPFTMFGDG
jgi:UDP-glucuronate 4-epimerase